MRAKHGSIAMPLDDAGDDAVELALRKNAGVGLDPAGVSTLLGENDSRGIPEGLRAPVYQGYRLQPIILGYEHKLADGRLWHSGSAMMAWCVGNARVEQKGNAISITKQVAGRAKIDR